LIKSRFTVRLGLGFIADVYYGLIIVISEWIGPVNYNRPMPNQCTIVCWNRSSDKNNAVKNWSLYR